jgi:hypothetical protein
MTLPDSRRASIRKIEQHEHGSRLVNTWSSLCLIARNVSSLVMHALFIRLRMGTSVSLYQTAQFRQTILGALTTVSQSPPDPRDIGVNCVNTVSRLLPRRRFFRCCFSF